MSTVRSKVLIGAFALCFAAMCGLLVGCSGNNSDSKSESNDASINVTSREDGVGIEEKDDSGKKVDKTTSSAAITNSTAVMKTTVANDTDAIGYISLGSLDDTVKAVKIDGAEATAENVKSGSYKVSRPFNVVTNSGKELSPVARDFMKFVLSSDGQKVVEEQGYIPMDASGSYVASGLSGKVTVAGSSSVTPVMEKLAEAYRTLNPNVTVEVNQSDSTTGITSAIEGACDLGMASRDLKDSEKDQGATATVIATDGIAVIVNNGNKFDCLTADQVKQIFTGEVSKWSEIG